MPDRAPHSQARLLWADEHVALPSLEGRSSQAPGRLQIDPERAERGMAQLVLTVIELLRQLMERQALRRVEHGTLTEDQEEQLGLALMRLAETMDELKDHFNLNDEDLNLHLGPLGDLL
ncbi:MAG: gas vesicle protein K [Acidimicrobiaceae bacterium]|nr:gas vesicle protein K [Acidimicrobiaceae bacterium]